MMNSDIARLNNIKWQALDSETIARVWKMIEPYKRRFQYEEKFCGCDNLGYERLILEKADWDILGIDYSFLRSIHESVMRQHIHLVIMRNHGYNKSFVVFSSLNKQKADDYCAKHTPSKGSQMDGALEFWVISNPIDSVLDCGTDVYEGYKGELHCNRAKAIIDFFDRSNWLNETEVQTDLVDAIWEHLIKLGLLVGYSNDIDIWSKRHFFRNKSHETNYEGWTALEDVVLFQLYYIWKNHNGSDNTVESYRRERI